MIIKNNTPKKRVLFYKVNGKVFKTTIAAYGESTDIEEITSENQILFNAKEFKLRHIKEALGKDFDAEFSFPGDSGFEGFYITSTVSVGGTISPTVKVPKGEDKIFTIVASPKPFLLSATTNNFGYVSPNGNSINMAAQYYLTGLTVDSTNQISGITGNLSGTSYYTFHNVSTAHSIAAAFDLTPYTKQFTFVSSATTYTYTASTTGGGWVSPSGNSLSVTSGYYLSSTTLDGTSVAGSVTGNLSGTSYYVMTGLTTGKSLIGNFGIMLTSSTITMTANTGNYLTAITLNNTYNVISAATGNLSGTSYYNLTGISDSTNYIVAGFGVI